ncbi:MAG: DUF5011 domain-containing protein [Candidatus Pacebacteria bacterium]|nr:DUF5011 domain-containing protein [Candidatus Paceibacterota bacterium]
MKNNFIKEYGKVVVCFMFLVVFLIPKFSFASGQCSKSGYTVLVINGVNTTQQEAENNATNLESKFKPTYNGENLNIKYLYNPTHTAIADLLDAGVQKTDDQSMSDLQDSDFAQMLNDASNKVKTQKLLLVGHSQGNFYANTFYDTVVDATGGIPSQSIGVYAVATPANRVSGINSANYITSDTDQVIDHIPGILKPNVHIDFKASDGDLMGHDFSKIYLKYEGAKIVSDIDTSLNKLKTNDIQNENVACINPPKLTLPQKIQGTILSTLDHVTLPFQDALVYVATGVTNVTVAIANTTVNLTGSAISAVSSLFNQTVSNTNTLATSGGGDVINSIEPTTLSNSTSTQLTENLQPTPQFTSPQNVSIINSSPTTETTSSNSAASFVGRGGGGEVAMAEENDEGAIIPPTIPPIDNNPPSTDVTPPVITVLGDNPAVVVQYDTYTDAGATATDDVDGAINVVASGTVDTTTVGIYTITYTATDSSGNIATATRSVTVVASQSTTNPPPSPLSTFTIDKDTTLTAGEYNYENLLITNNAILTLQGDPTSSSAFKGVKINADNITIDPGSSISADGEGYAGGDGPGNSSVYYVGASYGGLSYNGATYSQTYGSAIKPTDLGSGGHSSGGGAIELNVSNTFTDDGTVSADGNISSSGGSIYVTAQNITGSGILQADGGNLFGSGYFQSPGGGGRIAVYYQTSTFSGTAEAKGGCGSYDSSTNSCAGDGTVGFFNTSTNDLYLNNSWEFLQADAPFLFNNIYISNGAKVTSENDVTITTKNNFIVDKNSSFALADNQILNSPTLIISSNSTLTLSGTEKITSNDLILTGNSTLTIVPQKILSLTIPNIHIDSGSSISADGKGYGQSEGPGEPAVSGAGASYGGVGYQNSLTSTYGSQTNPVDLGSGAALSGGGAIQLIVSNTFENDGIVSASGSASGSGGSININTNSLSGTGAFSADGGGLYGNGYFQGPGGGGRVAISYNATSFSGTVEAKGGCGSYDGWSSSCAGGGTVYILNESVPVQSSLKTITAFDFSNLTPIVSGVVDETNHAISLTVPYGTDITTLVPMITISDKASISPTTNTSQDFTNPVTYKITAEDGSTQNYVVNVTVAPNPDPPVTPPQTPSTTLPSITSYTFNGTAGNIIINPTAITPFSLMMTASENVNWMSIKIENQNDSSTYKIFQSGAGCVDGTNTCTKSWDGALSKGGLLQNGTFRIKVHVKDSAGNEYDDYLTPYIITVDTSL